jgi:peptide-methionine (S)-S-oxide reductase
MRTNVAMAMFGTGCFWCSEAVFQRIPGVISVRPGYAGGTTKNPTYKEVCAGNSGHAEVVQIQFDSDIVSYGELLNVFWKCHDPTTLNRQGNDVGTQYRSVIFCYDANQRSVADKSKELIGNSGVYKSPVVTEITEAGLFYPAEAYHVDYYSNNKSEPYCRFIITPKLDKLFKK